MEIKESGDERCYPSETDIPTIQLGSGGTIISTLDFPGDIVTGIGFTLGSQDDEVNQKHPEIGIFLRILSTNPDSFDVLIDKLQIAKLDLIKKLEE